MTIRRRRAMRRIYNRALGLMFPGLVLLAFAIGAALAMVTR